MLQHHESNIIMTNNLLNLSTGISI